MKTRRTRRGFTLIELLVVIVIIAGLASLAFAFTTRSLLKAQKVKAIQQMRDLQQGMEAYIVDHNRPPIPDSGPAADSDTVYGVPRGGGYGNEEIILTLFGDTSDDSAMARVSTQLAAEMNPKGEQYMRFPMTRNGRYGVGEDGKLYDPWGGEFMIAINADSPTSPVNERLLETRGMGVWKDKEPRYERYAFWSYGKNAEHDEILAKSDDVAHW